MAVECEEASQGGGLVITFATLALVNSVFLISVFLDTLSLFPSQPGS